MNKAKNIKKTMVLSFFFFFRTFLFIPMLFLGVSAPKLDVLFSTRTILLPILLLLFSVLAALIVVKIQMKGGDEAAFLLILIISDPLFFTLQSNCLKLFVSCIGLLLILNMLNKKQIVKNEIILCLFLFVSSFLIVNSLFSYILLALMIYVFSNLNHFSSNPKRWFILIPASFCVVLGIALNKILGKTFDKFDDFINYFAFSQWEEFNSSRILALASVPLFVFGGYCLLMYNKQQNRFPKNSQERKYQNLPIDFFALSYVFSIIGFLLNKNEIFLTANIFVPIMFITMIISNSQSAERAIADVYTVVKKHYFLSTLLLIFYCVISYIMMNNYIVGAKCVNFATVY